MIFGATLLFYSQDPEADQAFFSKVLGFRSVDVGHGWLIFALPLAETAIRPTVVDFSQTHAGAELMGTVLYLMCDGLKAEIASLKKKKVRCGKIQKASGPAEPPSPYPAGAPSDCTSQGTRPH